MPRYTVTIAYPMDTSADTPELAVGRIVAISKHAYSVTHVTSVSWDEAGTRATANVEGFCSLCDLALLSREQPDGSLEESDYEVDQGGDLVCGECSA